MRPEQRKGYLLAVPALAAILAVVLYPLSFAFYFSLREVHPNLIGGWVGPANYSYMLRDPEFLRALSTTAVFTTASAGFSFLGGLAIALVLDRAFPGRGVVRVVVLLPWVFPAVVTATFVRILLNEETGPVGYALGALGLLDGPPLGDGPVLLVAAVLADAWRSAPFVALLLLAGLRVIPADLHDAARVDGAGAVQRFLFVTLPLLTPTLLIVLLFRVLDAFRVYDLFWVMSGRQLDSLSTYVYKNVMLTQLNFGLGMSGAVFVFVCALVTAAAFIAVLKARAPTGLQHSGLYGAAEPGPPGERVRYAVAGVAVISLAAPLLWVLRTSLLPTPEVLTSPPQILPGSLSGASYALVLGNPAFLRSLFNSAVISALTTLFALLLASPAAYAISRLQLRHGNRLLAVMLAVAFFPPVAILAPMLVQLGGLARIIHERFRRPKKERAIAPVPDAPRPDAAAPSSQVP